MDKEIERQLKFLRLSSIIYDDRIIDDLKDEDREYILKDAYLINLKTLIESNKKAGFLDPYTVNNIFETLRYIRQENGNSSIINEIICELNVINYDSYLYFYRDQYLKRSGLYTSELKEKCNMDFFDDPEVLSEIRFSMMFDYDILICLIEDNEEEVKEMEAILVSDFFTNTLNYIAYECPQALKLPKVKERIQNISHKIKKESHNKENDLNTLSRYRIYKLNKRIKRD